jgi:hypothetical protein
MPAHQVYVTLLDIWSHGCNPMLRYSLPILFSFEISSFTLSALGVYRRSHYALIRAEAETQAFQERVESALAFEKDILAKEMARKVKPEDEGTESLARTSGERTTEWNEADDEEQREEIEKLISQDEDRLGKLPSVNLGPSFGFGLGDKDSKEASE